MKIKFPEDIFEIDMEDLEKFRSNGEKTPPITCGSIIEENPCDIHGNTGCWAQESNYYGRLTSENGIGFFMQGERMPWAFCSGKK